MIKAEKTKILLLNIQHTSKELLTILKWIMDPGITF